MKKYNVCWYSGSGLLCEFTVAAAGCFEAKSLVVSNKNVPAEAIVRVTEMEEETESKIRKTVLKSSARIRQSVD